ncbi:MAG: DNA gyrase inhibitor YacG [Shimia sp.]
MSCPVCGRPTQAAHRPFCSRRCADVDLARWLSGGYAIPASEDDPDAPEPPTDDPKPH